MSKREGAGSASGGSSGGAAASSLGVVGLSYQDANAQQAALLATYAARVQQQQPQQQPQRQPRGSSISREASVPQPPPHSSATSGSYRGAPMSLPFGLQHCGGAQHPPSPA
jgi:hypothetical protein